MDCKAQNSFPRLQLANLSCWKLASALAKLCQLLQLKIRSVISMIPSHSAFWFCLRGIMKASATGEVSHCLMCGSHNSSVICATGNVKEEVKNFPAHFSAQSAQLSERKGSYWTPSHRAILLNSKSCEGKELETTALASRNSNSGLSFSCTNHLKLRGKIRDQNTLKKCCMFSLCFRIQVSVYTRFNLIWMFSVAWEQKDHVYLSRQIVKKIMLKWKIHPLAGSLALATDLTCC